MVEEDLSNERWHLGESIGLQGKMSLDLMREMSIDESQASIKALNLISRLTTSSKWNDVLEAWRMVESGLSQTNSSATLRTFDEHVFRLLQALRRFDVELTAIRAWAAEAFEIDTWPDVNPQWVATAENLVELPASPFRTVRPVDVSNKPGQVRTRIALTPRAATYLGLDNEHIFDARVWLETATALAEQEHAALLRALDKDITESARILLRLGAEVFIGATVLVLARDLAALGTGKSFTPTIRELPLEHIPRLMLALRDAKSSVLQSRAPSDETDVGSAGAQADAEASAPKQDSGLPLQNVVPQAAIDPAGLHAETNRMSNRLERLWTKSLERAITDDVLAEELSRWHTLLASSSASMLGHKDADAEVRFPLSASDVVDFVASRSDDPGPVTHLYSVALLSNAIRDFSRPETVLDSTTGTLEAWWSSGGFARLRDAADLLLRGISETPEASGEISTDSFVRRPATAKTALALANRCLHVGAPEASLTYLVQAWDEFIANRQARSGAEESLEGVAAFAKLLPSLKDAATRFGEGEQIPLRVALPLAFTGVELLNRLDGTQITMFARSDDQN